MKLIAIAVLAALSQIAHVRAATLLDRPVPWAGTIRKQTLGEVVARMTGWADVDAKQSLRFTTPLTQVDTGKMIDQLKIASDPRPSYGAVLLAAFTEAGYTMAIEESENGIVVARLLTRIFRLDYATIARWRKAGDYSTEGFSARLRKSGYQTSKHLVLNLSPGNGSLLVSGVQKDLDAVSNFLGQ
jgi:hypothetical protein